MNYFDIARNDEDLLMGGEAVSPQGPELKEELLVQMEIIEHGYKRGLDGYSFFKDSETKKAIEELDKIVYKHTGITVETNNFTGTHYACIPMALPMNNKLFGSLYDNYKNLLNNREHTEACLIKDMDQKCAVSRLEDTLTKGPNVLMNSIKDGGVTVDTKKGRIDGLGEEYKTYMLVNYNNCFKDGAQPRHMVAIILHEIGHLFTAIQYMHRSVVYTTSLEDKVRKFKTKDEKIQFIADEVGADVSGKSTVIDIATVFNKYVNNTIKDVRTLTTGNHDSEFIADSFAVSYGIGADLAEGLVIITNQLTSRYEYGMFMTNSVLNGFHILLFGTFIGGGGALVGLWIITTVMFLVVKTITVVYDTLYSDYDDLHKRVRRIRSEMMHASIEYDIEMDLGDIEAVDKLLDNINKPSIFSRVLHSLFGSSDTDKEDALEELMTNSVYYHANKFKKLTEEKDR